MVTLFIKLTKSVPISYIKYFSVYIRLSKVIQYNNDNWQKNISPISFLLLNEG